MTARSVVLTTHLCLGAAAALFLFILGLTGAILAFENDIDHWLYPSLYYVQAGPRTIPEADLVAAVERRFAPDRVKFVHIFREKNLVQMMQLARGGTVFVDPYNAGVLGSRTKQPWTEDWLGYIHQLHTHLVPNPRSAPRAGHAGAIAVQIAGFMLCLLAPTGLILWWRMKRGSVKWRASWFRICFDLHNTVSLTHSSRPSRFPDLHSTEAKGAQPIPIDRAEAIARAALTASTVSDLLLPQTPRDVFVLALRRPEETSESVHSYAFVDQYSGRLLHLTDFYTDSFGYRVIRFNRSIHTGDIFGTAGHLIMALSSFLLAVMAATGVVIWLKKLAV
ncbi:MAG TPA: PepSY-associated TM helix domain-containing protein [Bryobacteraceae bacterium]|nr:PepSY-associated TM helix domain-containing protein [Bryobacteraceae bacterium]